MAGKGAPADLFLDGFFVDPDALAGPATLMNVEHGASSRDSFGLLRSCLMRREISAFALYKEKQKYISDECLLIRVFGTECKKELR